MPEDTIEDLLNDLNSPNSQQAWNQFLSDYSQHIYQVIRHFESDLDNAADCFQFVCEQLFENGSKRLRKFKGEGTATFTTWLRAVVRNLCVDWHRKQFGRQRQFRSITRLSAFDREVYRIVYEQATSPNECLAILSNQFPNTTAKLIDDSRTRIEELLTPNQRWILSQRSTGNGNKHTTHEEQEHLFNALPADQPDPEELVIEKERKERLRRALSDLTPNESLLIRLRFQEGVTLNQVSKLLELGNAQRADRQINEILMRLRKAMDS